jgi:hypothetical protein
VAKKRYVPKVCEGEVCKAVGKAKATMEQAARVMQKAMKKASKRRFKKPPKGDFRGNTIHGEVWESERGKIVGEQPVYVGAETYGEPPAPRQPRRPRAPRSEE